MRGDIKGSWGPSPSSGPAAPAERPGAILGHGGVRSGGEQARGRESSPAVSPPPVATKRSPPGSERGLLLWQNVPGPGECPGADEAPAWIPFGMLLRGGRKDEARNFLEMWKKMLNSWGHSAQGPGVSRVSSRDSAPMVTGKVLWLPNPPRPSSLNHNPLQSFSWVFPTPGSLRELPAS